MGFSFQRAASNLTCEAHQHRPPLREPQTSQQARTPPRASDTRRLPPPCTVTAQTGGGLPRAATVVHPNS